MLTAIYLLNSYRGLPSLYVWQIAFHMIYTGFEGSNIYVIIVEKIT